MHVILDLKTPYYPFATKLETNQTPHSFINYDIFIFLAFLETGFLYIYFFCFSSSKLKCINTYFSKITPLHSLYSFVFLLLIIIQRLHSLFISYEFSYSSSAVYCLSLHGNNSMFLKFSFCVPLVSIVYIYFGLYKGIQPIKSMLLICFIIFFAILKENV